jgi:hypothetical protein
MSSEKQTIILESKYEPLIIFISISISKHDKTDLSIYKKYCRHFDSSICSSVNLIRYNCSEITQEKLIEYLNKEINDPSYSFILSTIFDNIEYYHAWNNINNFSPQLFPLLFQKNSDINVCFPLFAFTLRDKQLWKYWLDYENTQYNKEKLYVKIFRHSTNDQELDQLIAIHEYKNNLDEPQVITFIFSDIVFQAIENKNFRMFKYFIEKMCTKEYLATSIGLNFLNIVLTGDGFEYADQLIKYHNVTLNSYPSLHEVHDPKGLVEVIKYCLDLEKQEKLTIGPHFFKELIQCYKNQIDILYLMPELKSRILDKNN